MKLPDPVATLARELALLERKGYTLTDEERRFLARSRELDPPARTFRRRHLTVIEGGKA